MFGVVVHDVQRFAAIANVLRKFGFGNLVQAVRSGLRSDFNSSSEILNSFRDQPSDMAANLRAAIEELGTTYIKFGQMLSTRYDLLPRNIIDELTKLQDGSPKMPFDTVEGILNEAYGDYHTVFATFEETPLGAASIAQAHRATLKDGTHVVVKIQRPGLLPLIRSDIDILNIIAKTLDNNIEEISYFDLPALIGEFERSIIDELDFHNEMHNIEYFIEHYSAHTQIVFPTPYPEFSKHNILVMHELVGQKITTVTPDTDEARQMADAILNSKLSLAAEKKIRIKAEAKIPVALTTSELDLAIIIGNLLDNAIEATSELPEEERLIRLYMEMKGNFLYLALTNTAKGQKKRNFRTTKGEGHGLGLERVDAAVKKRGGYLTRASEDGAFSTEIMLPQ